MNTVLATGGRLVGHNTDGQGFMETLRDRRRGEELVRVVTAGTGAPAASVPENRRYALPATRDVLVNAP